MIKEKKIKYFLVLAFLTSSTLYLAKITTYSPVYFLIGLLSGFSIIYLVYKKKASIKPDVVLAIILAFYLVLTQSTSYITAEFINLFLGLSGYIFVRTLSAKLSLLDLIKIFVISFKVNATILSLDTIFRLMNPGVPSELHRQVIESTESLHFYLYKFNTLMFADSNTTGLIAVTFTILYIIINDIKPIKLSKYWIIVMIAIIILSLSRSAIITIIATYILHITLKINLRFRVIILTLFTFALTAGFLFFTNEIRNIDGSMSTKFYLFEVTYDLLFNKLDLSSVLLGVGFDSYIEYVGLSTHLLLLTIVSGMGILGLIIYLTFIIYYAVKFSFILMFSILLMSMSYFLYAGAPFLFIPMAILASIISRYRDETRMFSNNTRV